MDDPVQLKDYSQIGDHPRPDKSPRRGGSSNPDQSSVQAKPSNPDQSSAQAKPSNPDQSSAQAKPSNPDQSSAQAKPSNPDQSSAQAKPSNPDQSSAQAKPSDPGQSSAQGDPSNPGQSSAEREPSNPGQSSAEREPSNPGQSSAQGESSRPGQSPRLLYPPIETFTPTAGSEETRKMLEEVEEIIKDFHGEAFVVFTGCIKVLKAIEFFASREEPDVESINVLVSHFHIARKKMENAEPEMKAKFEMLFRDKGDLLRLTERLRVASITDQGVTPKIEEVKDRSPEELATAFRAV